MAESSTQPRIDLAGLRRETVGCDYRFHTPFGSRLMVYADHTASGRNVKFIERYLMKIQESYANTHTEDDETGRSTTEMLHAAERIIKEAVHGNETTCFAAAGTGTTGAIQRLQQILGLYIPPVTRDWLERQADRFAKETGSCPAAFLRFLGNERPVVFVGPYEHHSNEISWRESLAEVVAIAARKDGHIDLEDLEKKVSDPAYRGQRKIGAVSAASNVTGILTPVYDVARILHRNGAIACFDFAACAPYVEIDMNRDEESYFDAIYFSPHKFLGGPGATGVLLFRRELYRSDLPPTFAAGGTVDYVGPLGYDYSADIETREKAGTPGTLQVMKAALAMQLKAAVGVDRIAAREEAFLEEAIRRFSRNPRIDLLGRPEKKGQIAVLSFNIRHGDRFLHPKLVTRLFNDLFGIQTRAGCSCAGPYGHFLLGIGSEASEEYRCQVGHGYQGIKPGWVRIGFHYTLDDIDFQYMLRAVELLADKGPLFLSRYRFDLRRGTWAHVEEKPKESSFGLSSALGAVPEGAALLTDAERAAEYDRYIEEAGRVASALEAEGEATPLSLPDGLEKLSYFRVSNVE